MKNITTSQIINILSAVLMAQVAFNALLAFLMPVPLIVIGFGQLIPGLLVIIMAPNYRSELLQSLRRLGSIKTIIGACLLAALIILICCGLAYEWSGQKQDLEQLPSIYPFADFLPEVSLFGFFAFLLLVAPFLHLLNATGEEVFWRGYLLSGLTENFGQPKAVFLSGLCWGIWHIPMVVFLNWVFPQAFLGSILFTIAMMTWGYILCYIRIRTDSLWAPILMHATANAFVIGAYDSIATPEFNIFTSPWGMTGIALTLLIALIVYFKAFRKPEI